MRDAFLIDGVRTPIGSLGGALAPVRADDMAAHVLRALVARHPTLDPATIGDVMMGCANQAGEDNRNVARMALLLAGLPTGVPGETVNRLCASGMAAAVHAVRAIAVGDGEVYLAGGVESMSRAPLVLSKSESPFARNQELFDTSLGWRFVNPKLEAMYGIDAMGQTAENVAELHGVSREDQDRFAAASQQRAAAARARGRFAEEIVPVEVSGRKREPAVLVSEDEFIRPDTTIEKLATLRPAFRTDGQGSVTAGNSSGLNDGAAAMVITSAATAAKMGKKPLARIIANAIAGCEPHLMGYGPVPAVTKLLKKTGMKLDDIDLIECNEAFAAQYLSCERGLGLDRKKVNVNGSGIALGHPVGCTGARIMISLIYEMKKRNLKRGIATLCVGGGMGGAVMIENIQ